LSLMVPAGELPLPLTFNSGAAVDELRVISELAVKINVVPGPADVVESPPLLIVSTAAVMFTDCVDWPELALSSTFPGAVHRVSEPSESVMLTMPAEAVPLPFVVITKGALAGVDMTDAVRKMLPPTSPPSSLLLIVVPP